MMIDWEKRWQSHQTGWDLGAASPPLTAYADQIFLEKRHFRVLMPGCGNGYEAIHLLQNGFSDITMLDIAPSAIAHLEQRLSQTELNWQAKLKLVCTDFFHVEGVFDLILEQTFFCALDPEQRPDYVRKMSDLLAPGGKLAGVLFNRTFEGGPPFGGDTEEYRRLFDPYFELKTLETCYNSAAPRAGSEVFFIFEKKGS
ncbi:MAG: methyltransferase domain-containing protein [Saprospiraceae bacterium]